MAKEWDWKSVREKKTQAEEAQPAQMPAGPAEPAKTDFDWQPLQTVRAGRPGPGKAVEGKKVELMYDHACDCAFCDGSGEHAGNKCSVCHGRGVVKVKPPVVRCPFCHGHGEVRRLSGVTCLVCKGKGYARVKEPVEICGSCRGRGRKTGEALYCLSCKGSGVVTIKGASASGAPGWTPRRVSIMPSEREVLWALDEVGGEAGKTEIGG